MSMLTHPVSRGQAAGRGLLAAVLGGVLVAWPHITIGTVVVLFAVYCVTDAITVARRASMPGLTGGDRTLLGIRAAIEIGAAVTAVVWPGITASALTVVVGLYAITAGGLELAGYGLLAKYGVRAGRWPVAGGVASIVAGLLLVFWPGIGAVTLAVVFGAYLVVYGVIAILAALVTPHGEPVAA
jgi:uncharacterized membrane protein HdeD (DUF308 family)